MKFKTVPCNIHYDGAYSCEYVRRMHVHNMTPRSAKAGCFTFVCMDNSGRVSGTVTVSNWGTTGVMLPVIKRGRTVVYDNVRAMNNIRKQLQMGLKQNTYPQR